MMSQEIRLAVIPGDGIGPEVTESALNTLQAVSKVSGIKIEWDIFDYSAEKYLREGITFPDNALDILQHYDAIFLGALGDPRVPDMRHARDILFGIRFGLDLFANIRPVKLLDPRLCPLKNIESLEFTVIRENTEGLYAGMGGIFKKGTPDEVAIQEDVNTRKGVERVIRFAFEFARSHHKKEVCMSDKSNALRFGHDLWYRAFFEIAEEYPDIHSRHLYVDALAMQIIKNPLQFDVIVTCNMFGDIISDMCAQLQGGLGMAPSGNVHPDHVSMFEPVHGSAPKYAGKNVANPMAAILTAAMLLRHLGFHELEHLIETAVQKAIRNNVVTRDLALLLNCEPRSTTDVTSYIRDVILNA